MSRAPIKLSREMKLLLLLLLMVALIGAWYVWTSNRTAAALPPSTAGAADPAPVTDSAGAEPTPAPDGTADTTAQQEGNDTPVATAPAENPAAATAADPAANTVPLGPVTDAEQDDAGAEGTLPVQSNRPVEIEVIPPFPTPEITGDGTLTSTPGGINPQASVAAVPRKNPFRPMSLDASAQNDAQNTSGNTAQNPEDAAEITSPVSAFSGEEDSAEEPTPILPGSTAGPLALSPIPGAVGSGAVSGGLGNLPPIPGASSGAVSGGTPERTISGNSTDSGVTVIAGSAATPGSGTAGTPALGGVVLTAPKAPKPIVPPIAGVNVPSVTRVAGAARPSAASPASGPGTAPGAGTSRPVPGTPQVITSLGQGADDGDASASSDARKLEQFVQGRQLSFNAAVLGPINTAIFRGQDGYVVVAVGQTLPDSQVTVKEVSASSAVLSLGSDLKTLELDQR